MRPAPRRSARSTDPARQTRRRSEAFSWLGVPLGSASNLSLHIQEAVLGDYTNSGGKTSTEFRPLLRSVLVATGFEKEIRLAGLRIHTPFGGGDGEERNWPGK